MHELGYLDKKELGFARKLWEDVFTEETKEFGDYYFHVSCKDNRILAIKEDGDVIAMLHQNPYSIQMGHMVRQAEYIVGVSTRKDKRNQGYMGVLLETMMRNGRTEEIPFVFLMPSNEKLYRPFGFRFIYKQKRYEEMSNLLLYEREERKAGELSDEEKLEVSQWMNAWVSQHFDVFAVRNLAYTERLDKELSSERGVWRFFRKNGVLHGIEAEWGLDKREQRLFYVDETIQDAIQKKEEYPAIMARIITLPVCIRPIRLREDCMEESFCVTIWVEDPIIQENQGEWIWELNKKGSVLRRRKQEEETETEKQKETEKQTETEGLVSFDISELTEWLFGYRMPDSTKVPWANQIQVVSSVFLDEVV